MGSDPSPAAGSATYRVARISRRFLARGCTYEAHARAVYNVDASPVVIRFCGIVFFAAPSFVAAHRDTLELTPLPLPHTPRVKVEHDPKEFAFFFLSLDCQVWL